MNEFRNAIAKIEIDGTNVRGTAFLVASDLVATALHVVADRTTEPPTFFPGTIRVEFRNHTTQAELIPNKWNQDADCVLLRCLDPAPLALYPTIPLRELDHSDDLFKTQGYPDAQPIDGMIWVGKVRDHSAQLTNFYATRRSAYRPVLQLFCEEAAAGSGAPPKGLSGAPVIIGTSAVGLLRFALMRDGGTIAGTLYACTATDIVALDPQRLSLRPPLAPIVILTSEQAKQLTVLLVEAFKDNLSGLRRAVRFSLGVEAERSVTSAKDPMEFASTLLPSLLQLGPGMISVLLRGAVTACPAHMGLRSFAQQISPYALEQLNDVPDVQEAHDEALVTEISSALIDLNSMRRQAPELQHIMASYRPDFEKTRLQIRILAKYKELHNCLHEVQKRLDGITNNVTRLKAGDNVLLYLKDDASFLRDLVRKARSQIPGLPTADEESEWIDTLNACALAMKAAADQTAPVAEREKVLDVPERLAHILPQASHINEELVDAAKRVRLDNFAETMRSVEQQLGATMPENSLKLLRDASLAVGRLRSRLAGLIAEHDEWQSLNTDFEYTKTQTKHQPQARFSSWRQFKAKLIGLCDAFPQEEWSVELKKTMKPWMADDPQPEPQIPSNKNKLDSDFLSFYKMCVERFIEVDDELNRLCKKVITFTTPLDVLLKA
jgi:hypothetical protein